jgi:hypothetical protein
LARVTWIVPGLVLALAGLGTWTGCSRSSQAARDAGADAGAVPDDGGDARPGPDTADSDAGSEQVCSGTRVEGRCLVTLAAGEIHPYNLAVNATHLYWTTTFTAGFGKVMRVALAGGEPEELATGENPHTIVLDDTSVYWTDFVPATGAIMKMPLAGGPPILIVGKQENPHGLAVDHSFVYWTNFDGGQIRKAGKDPPTGGTSPFVDLAFGRSPNNLIVDDTFAYWTESVTAGAIMKVRLAGDAGATVIAQDQDNPYGVALDTSNIYWTNYVGGQVMKMPLDGSGPPVVLASGQVQPFGIEVDGTSVYWSNYRIGVNDAVGEVRKAPIAGGDWTELTKATSYDIAVDGTSVYWTAYEGGVFDGGIVEGGMVLRMTPK